jgi:serine/threonine protein phosphatase 1
MQKILSLLLGRWRKPNKPHESSFRRPRINMKAWGSSETIYAVPDIHGCLQFLHDAEARIMNDMEQRGVAGLIVYLGDYVDRGPDSSGVIEHLTKSSIDGAARITLCGNHDDIFHATLSGARDPSLWLSIGGRQTLMSYGMRSAEITLLSKSPAKFSSAMTSLIPESHRSFLEHLPVSAMIGPDLVFVHAGVRPGIPFDQQTDDDLMWIRDPFLTDGPQLPLLVVHGHTIVQEPVVLSDRIGLDTAAYLTGRLTVLAMTDGDIRFI